MLFRSVYIDGKGTFVVGNGGSITNYGESSTALFSYGTSVIINNGGSINNSGDNSAAIFSEGASVIVNNGGTVINNGDAVNYHTAAIYANGDANITLNAGGRIIANGEEYYNYRCYAVQIQPGTFTDNNGTVTGRVSVLGVGELIVNGYTFTNLGDAFYLDSEYSIASLLAARVDVVVTGHWSGLQNVYADAIIPADVTLTWNATFSGNLDSYYMLYLEGKGVFNIGDGGSITNSGVDSGTLYSAGVEIIVNSGGTIKNTGNAVETGTAAIGGQDLNVTLNIGGAIVAEGTDGEDAYCYAVLINIGKFNNNGGKLIGMVSVLGAGELIVNGESYTYLAEALYTIDTLLSSGVDVVVGGQWSGVQNVSIYIDIPAGRTLTWQAVYAGHYETYFLLYLRGESDGGSGGDETGGGTFIVNNGGSITNSGDGSGTLYTDGVDVTICYSGAIMNTGDALVEDTVAISGRNAILTLDGGTIAATGTAEIGFFCRAIDGVTLRYTSGVLLPKLARVAPTGVTTERDGDSWKIIGVDSTMEYREESETTYTPVGIGETEIIDLVTGRYYVRYIETAFTNASWDAPANASADITVSISAINGVTAPVYGATPVTTITETEQFTGVVSWFPVSSTFAANTVYTAYITITPKEGYTLFGTPMFFFTVSGVDSTGVRLPVTDESITVVATFPATGSPPTNPGGGGLGGGTPSAPDNTDIKDEETPLTETPDDEVWENPFTDIREGDRSEERRVGKECRSRWSPYH